MLLIVVRDKVCREEWEVQKQSSSVNSFQKLGCALSKCYAPPALLVGWSGLRTLVDGRKLRGPALLLPETLLFRTTLFRLCGWVLTTSELPQNGPRARAHPGQKRGGHARLASELQRELPVSHFPRSGDHEI